MTTVPSLLGHCFTMMPTVQRPTSAILPILVCALVFLMPCNADHGDKYNCPLNASSPFSWVVMIWDMHKDAKSGSDGQEGTASMGSFITCNAVLTTAFYYTSRVFNDLSTFSRVGGYKRFRVIGHYIYDYTSGDGRKHPCYQNLTVKDIEIHPKAKIAGQRILFDFAVVVTTKPFSVISPTFPIMVFPSTTLELVLAIRFINVVETETYCAIPTTETFEVREWIWNARIDVRTKPFHSQCVRVLCQQKQSTGHAVDKPECVKKLKARLNATMLCMVPNWGRTIWFPPNSDGSLFPNILAGSPLICNGSTLGISNFVKARDRMNYPDYAQDIFFTITLLRTLPWLSHEITKHTPPIDPFFIEDKDLTKVDIPDPSRYYKWNKMHRPR